eukprot:jgi/Ulvmu1/7844/UM004_0074.1
MNGFSDRPILSSDSGTPDRIYLDVDRNGSSGWNRHGSIWQGIKSLLDNTNEADYERMPGEKTYDSMEYNPPNSAVYRAWLSRQPHGRSWDKWLLMAAIGCSVGTVSFCLQQAIKFLFTVRENVGRYFLDWDMVGGYMLAWFFYVAASAFFATVASILVVMVAPAASASGVPQIMAFLNGVRMPKILNMWTFIVKFWSCALSVAAGLPVGPEGPIIHMGAFLGSAISGLHSTTLRFDLGVFRHLRSSKHKRDFVTAGVAAGVAAAFDAPLGGLLFAFEEVASFWHSHLGWQVFFCCVLAVLTQNLLYSLDRAIHNTGHFGFFSGNVTFKVGVEVYAHVLTIVPAALLGIACGAFAIAFTKLNLGIARWRAAVIKPSNARRILEVLLMTLVYVGVCMLLPHFFPCRETACTKPRGGGEVRCSSSSSTAAYHTNALNETVSDTNEGLALTPDLFTCPYVVNPEDNQEYIVLYNSMATLINPLGEDTISRLFARGVHREFGYMTLLMLLGWYFLGAAWAAGMEISSGMFVPMLLIGAVLGRLAGLLMVDMFPVDPGSMWWLSASDDQWKWIDPGVFAVVGAAAFMGGVTRLTVALAAIMMEVSSDVQMLLPVLVAILAAKAFADTFVPHSYYHSIMEVSQVPFLPPNPHTHVDLDLVTVSSVMSSPVQTIPTVVKLQDLEALLRDTPHNGYPVVHETPSGSLSCSGLVARNHLLVLLERSVQSGSTQDHGIAFTELNKHVEDPLNTFSSAQSIDTVLDRPLTMASAEHLHVPLSMLESDLDLSRFVDSSTYMVPVDFPLKRAYSLFTSMGLRHLVVVDDLNAVQGIITRENITPARLEQLQGGH